jgi:hypothetical protein
MMLPPERNAKDLSLVPAWKPGVGRNETGNKTGQDVYVEMSVWVQASRSISQSVRENRPRALIQLLITQFIHDGITVSCLLFSSLHW